ncbi:MAG: nucleotidyl transferase AbiEii/AbiGii toxin family protein [Dehalococcoidia bacterium]
MTADPGDSRFVKELSAMVASAGIRVVLIGGAAVNTYVEPRYTKDIDLTVAADPAGLEALTGFLHDAGFVTLRHQPGEASSGPDFVQLKREATQDMVDLIAAKTPFQRLLMERAERSDGQWLPVATPEDLIVLKLIANRSRDRLDVEQLVAHCPIDWPYVTEWAATWGVADRLQALRDALTDEES